MTVLDVFRWITIAWLLLAMGWLVQVAVVSRSTATTFLMSGLILNLFMGVGAQFEELGNTNFSYHFPVIFPALILTTIGMYYYISAHEGTNFFPPFYFFKRYRARKGRERRQRREGTET